MEVSTEFDFSSWKILVFPDYCPYSVFLKYKIQNCYKELKIVAISFNCTCTKHHK